VPRGRYLVGGEVEEFACAAGPVGWRYTGVRRESGHSIDLTLDAMGRPFRVELASPDWVLRGGWAGTSVLWLRRPAVGQIAGVERSAVAHGFFGDSPGFCVAVARLLRLDAGQARRVRLLEVTGPALATRLVEVEWRCAEVASHPAGAGAALAVTRYDAVPVDTGEPRTVYLAGDVVVAADGVELLELDSPPEEPRSPTSL
jgi:hypothetical protein